MDPYIGQVFLFAFSFLPDQPMYYHLCDGSSLQVSSYQALYSLIGNTYGGNTQSFNLPNLLGAEPVPNMQYYIAIQGIYPTRQ
jgi:microcystin-dependent protein